MSRPPRYAFKSAKHIFETEYPEPSFLVPNLIPMNGLSILAGPFKGCKSWFLLYLCMILSTSGQFLGNIDLQRRKGLYLALEDSEARLHHRMHCLGFKPGDDCLISTTFPAGREGVLHLRKIFADDPTIEYAIIDTLGKFSTGRGKSGFQEDYDWIGSIKDIAEEFSVAIVLVHHLRKMGDDVDVFNEISGTCGSMAVADAILVLKKERNTGKGTLSCHVEISRRRDMTCSFPQTHIAGQSRGKAFESASTPERQEILDILKAYGEMTPAQISDRISRSSKSVSNILSKLKGEGLVVTGSRYGSWVSTESLTSSTSSGGVISDSIENERVLSVV
jgi:DNA-binding transcriptional ArsR family regulator